MRTLILRDSIPWFGARSGYEQLTRYLDDIQPVDVVAPRQGRAARYLGSASSRLRGRVGRGAADLAELEFRARRRALRPGSSHILYLEDHLRMLTAWSSAPRDLVGTVHLPPSVWSQEQKQHLARLQSAIVLYQRDLDFFESHVGDGRVRFIHYGVDTTFFTPAAKPPAPRVLYCGVYLRNEDMLVRVIDALSATMPEVRFDLLVPEHHRNSPGLAPLADRPEITWHAGLSDEELRTLYHHAAVLMLPMNASGANTAVVEALASGVPIVTTDVGGIRDYGGGHIVDVVDQDDDDAMAASVLAYLQNPTHRSEVGRRCRAFAEEVLAWPVVAAQHAQAYRDLAE